MRPSRHFCGMAAAVSPPLLPGTATAAQPMHRLPARDNQGMDPFAPQERR
jgi:hypothetical protein